MSEETPETTEEVTPDTTEETTADTGTADQGTGDETESLRSALKKAREEAAKYRVSAREARESLEKATSPEDFEAVRTQLAQRESELAQARLAAKYNLPAAFANKITGDTDEAREADAKAMAEALHPRGTEVGKGGLNPGAKAPVTDPAALAAQVRRSRR